MKYIKTYENYDEDDLIPVYTSIFIDLFTEETLHIKKVYNKSIDLYLDDLVWDENFNKLIVISEDLMLTKDSANLIKNAFNKDFPFFNTYIDNCGVDTNKFFNKLIIEFDPTNNNKFFIHLAENYPIIFANNIKIAPDSIKKKYDYLVDSEELGLI